MCQAVLETVATLEDLATSTSTDTGSSAGHSDSIGSGNDSMSLKGRMYLIEEAFLSITHGRWYGHAGLWEFSYWVMQISALSCVLVIIYLLFNENIYYDADV